jgi:hypothetical protein
MTDADALLDATDEIPAESKRRLLGRLTRTRVGTALEVTGLSSVSFAAFGVNTLFGFLIAGACMIVSGVAVELGGR